MGVLKKNFAFAFGAQGLQLLQSVIWSLLIPKLMGVEQFGYWQLFIFYTQYGGFLSFGLIDGTFLKVGGQEYRNLDYRFLGFQLQAFLVWQIIILLPVALYGTHNVTSERSFTIIMSCIYVILYNVMTYLMYILQAVNEIKYMSFGKMLTAIFFTTTIILLLCLRVNHFEPYVIFYILCNTTCLTYYIIKTKEIARATFSRSFSEGYFGRMFRNIKVGAVLLFSNICGMLILGFGRFMVDNHWGIKAFSVVSFAFMFVNFFMSFVTQGSLVLFPELRRWDKEKVKTFYVKMRRTISILFPTALVLYLPIYLLVKFWLPQYLDSAKYLMFLLPLCIFDTKMNLLCNTLFKVYNKVKSLLLCNVLALSCSIVGILISLFVVKSMVAVVLTMLIAITVRSIVAEVLLSKIVKTPPIWNNLGAELALVAIFVSANWYLGIVKAFFVYLVALSVRLYYNRNELKALKKQIKK